MSPQIIQYFRLNGRFGCRTHLKIEKIVLENIAGAKKKPIRVDWLEKISVRESRPGQEARSGALDRGHYVWPLFTALGAYVWRLLFRHVFLLLLSRLLENLIVCSQLVYSEENDPSTKCPRSIKVIPGVTLASKLTTTFFWFLFS